MEKSSAAGACNMTEEANKVGVRQVVLDSERFVASVKRYIDEDKPDVSQQKQMEAWRIEWKNGDGDLLALALARKPQLPETTRTKAKNGGDLSLDTADCAVTGTLQIQGEYLRVSLVTACYWKGDCVDGSLFFSCHASASFVPPAEDAVEEDTATSAAAAAGDSSSKKARKRQAKIRTKVVERLRNDDYIRKLLKTADTDDDDDDQQQQQQKPRMLELCQATIRIRQSDQTLEERVRTSQVAAEAVRRAVFSAAESPLDVFDLVCRLPLLPSNSSNSDNSGTATDAATHHQLQEQAIPTTTPLADRAKLRLLEDATYDACENEEEDEIVEELNILDNGSEAPENSRSHQKKSKR